MTRWTGVLAIAILLSAATVQAQPYSQEDLLALTGPLSGWGAPADSDLNSSAADGADGVLFSVDLGTGEYGKLPLGKDKSLNWSAYDTIWLKVDVVSATGGTGLVELNPFIQSGGGWTFSEYKSGMTIGAGQSMILQWDISGIATRDQIKRFGFQMFQGGDVQNPASVLDAEVRVTAIPEPATLSLLALAGLPLLRRRRK